MEKIHLLTTSRNNNHAQRILIIYITWKIYFSHDTGKKIHAEKFKRLLWEIKKKKKRVVDINYGTDKTNIMRRTETAASQMKSLNFRWALTDWEFYQKRISWLLDCPLDQVLYCLSKHRHMVSGSLHLVIDILYIKPSLPKVRKKLVKCANRCYNTNTSRISKLMIHFTPSLVLAQK